MQKFIITAEGRFKYGDVRLHKHLLSAHDICLGGGYYEFDRVSARLLLRGGSYDYGTPKWHYLDELRLPGELRGMTVYYEGQDLRDLVHILFDI